MLNKKEQTKKSYILTNEILIPFLLIIIMFSFLIFFNSISILLAILISILILLFGYFNSLNKWNLSNNNKYLKKIIDRGLVNYILINGILFYGLFSSIILTYINYVINNSLNTILSFSQNLVVYMIGGLIISFSDWRKLKFKYNEFNN